MKEYIDITLRCVNSDFVKRQKNFNRKMKLIALLGIGYSALMTLELKKLRGEIEDLKKSKGEEM